jgi:hypothetical protein
MFLAWLVMVCIYCGYELYFIAENFLPLFTVNNSNNISIDYAVNYLLLIPSY